MDSISELISALKKFPGLGSKSAKRIVYYLLQQNNQELEKIGELISTLKKNLKACSLCGNISEKDPCRICSDPLRDKKTLCIVEDLEALSAFEEAGIYNGLYHVLGSKISPLDGQDLSDESIKFLLKHIKALKPDEIIIATSPKIEGDMTYYTLLDILKSAKTKKLSRLSFGLPMGGSIEFADKMTLHIALEARRQI